MWNRLIENNEQIARYNPVGAVKTMKGIAMEKYHAMEHEYPSKIDLIKRLGYDPKQLHHLLRVEEYLIRYTNGEKYADCLYSQVGEWLQEVKRTDHPLYTLKTARLMAENSLDYITARVDEFVEAHKDDPVDWHVDVLLDDVQRDIVKLGIELEIQKGE
jgi:hypothetical protein